jgi:flagellar protein FliO/FliZ
MHILLIVLTSFVALAADPARSVELSAEERILAANDEDATALLAEEFGNKKAVDPDEVQAPTVSSAVGDSKLPAQVSDAKVSLSETEIPVLTDAKKAKDDPVGSPLRKMVISLGIILTAIFGVAFAARKWFVKKKTDLPNAQIKILSQQFLGPRKSLAIVYVAGESLLVGITDNQINLIKQLSLIDDEIPADLPKKFDDSLSYADSVQPEDGENFSMRGIKDIVANRLKNMREI